MSRGHMNHVGSGATPHPRGQGFGAAGLAFSQQQIGKADEGRRIHVSGGNALAVNGLGLRPVMDTTQGVGQAVAGDDFLREVINGLAIDFLSFGKAPAFLSTSAKPLRVTTSSGKRSMVWR